MPSTFNLITGASQLAMMLAHRSGEGFSKDPDDYRPPRLKLSGPEFNEFDPKYRSDLHPDGLLFGDVAIAPEGLPVIWLGSLSGYPEYDRVTIDGRDTKRLHAIWKTQPERTVVRGKGGGLKTTEHGGWLEDKQDELFLLTRFGLGVLTLYNQHHVVVEINRKAQALGIRSMLDAKWQMSKKKTTDGGGYDKHEPSFELLGLAGAPEGPTEAEIAQAKRLVAMIGQLSHPVPGVPLKLVIGGNNFGSPPTPPAPPPSGEDDYGASNDGPPDPPADDDDLPDFLKK